MLPVIPGELRALAREVREGDPGVEELPLANTWVPFPSLSLGRG